MKTSSKCNKNIHICDRSQYKETGFLENMRMNIHILICKVCRDYSKRNGKLTKTIKSAKIRTLPPEQKEVLKNTLSEEIKRASNL